MAIPSRAAAEPGTSGMADGNETRIRTETGRDDGWLCEECGRRHPDSHKSCWHCHPTAVMHRASRKTKE